MAINRPGTEIYHKSKTHKARNANLSSFRFINETPDSYTCASVHHTEYIVLPRKDNVKKKSGKFTGGGQIPIYRADAHECKMQNAECKMNVFAPQMILIDNTSGPPQRRTVFVGRGEAWTLSEFSTCGKWSVVSSASTRRHIYLAFSIYHLAFLSTDRSINRDLYGCVLWKFFRIL